MMNTTDKLQHTVRMLGRDGVLPIVNDAAEAAGIEYAAACAICKAAEQRKEMARQALLEAVDKPSAFGTHVLLQSRHVNVTMQVVRPSKRVDTELLVQTIMQTCNVDKDTALSAIERAKVDTAPQQRISAILTE